MSRIEWTKVDMSSERGRVDGNDVFHLSYPGDWSDDFSLTSPLIFFGDRMGWLGTIGIPGPGPETQHTGKVTLKQARAALEADKAQWAASVQKAKAVAEAMLIDFARSILRDVDEPK